MSKENISVKFLIHLVGERPALWDKTSEEFKDRALKETSWREICTFINENYQQMQRKAKVEFTRMIMRKWTHIRDSWVKSMKYGYDEVTKTPPKPYIYHNDLHFMQKILKCRPPRYNLNMSEMSNMHFEEFYRDKNDTQTSAGASNDLKQNDEIDAASEGTHRASGKLSAEIFKQEKGGDESMENHEQVLDDDDYDWPLEETETTNQTNGNKQDVPVKKKRISIFKNSRNEDEFEKPRPEIVRPPPVVTQPVKKIERPISVVYERHSNENRHWNFFKGILPSVNGLDEDNVLQFQSGVIALLQKLRESQKKQLTAKTNRVSSHSLFKGRGRKRKASCDDDDREWSFHNITMSRRRSKRNNSDPIAADDFQSENEYSS